MEFKPNDANTIYASTKDYWGKDVVYRTTDAGANWSELFDFGYSMYRIDLAVTPANSNLLYVIVANRSSGLGEIGVYDASTNTYTTKYTGGTDNALLGYYSDASGNNSGQGSYDLVYCYFLQLMPNTAVSLGRCYLLIKSTGRWVPIGPLCCTLVGTKFRGNLIS